MKKETMAVVACMDEDLDYGPGVVIFGTAGSLITNLGEGDQEVYPDVKRKLIKKTREVVYAGLERVAEAMGMKLLVTSHAGCGAGAAQGIVGQEALEEITERMCGELGLDYAGYIPHAKQPVEIGEAGFTAHIGRSEAEHHHGARRVVITVGGGITEEEIQMVEADGYGDAFIISADWIAGVLASDVMKIDEIVEWLALHVDIADGIADGVQHVDSVRVYNANRLSKDVVDTNHRIVVQMLKIEREKRQN